MVIASLVNYAELNTFSLLFFTGSLLVQFFSGKYSITIAGFEWIDFDAGFPNWVPLMFIFLFNIGFILQWLASAWHVYRLRRRARLMRFPPLQSGLETSFSAAPSFEHSEKSSDISSSGHTYLYITLQLVVGLLPRIVLLIVVFTRGITPERVPFLFIFSSLNFLAALVFIGSIIEIQRHSYREMSFSFLSILLERLIDYNSIDRFWEGDFLIGLGFGFNENVTKISGGKMENGSSRDLFYSRLRAFRGIDENEYVIYGNENSIITIIHYDTEEVMKLTNIIHQHTKESVLPKSYGLGTLPWWIAISGLLSSIVGPGPWPGVEGMGGSIVWLIVIVLIAAFFNALNPVGSRMKVLSGKGKKNVEICRWIDREEYTWSIYCDKEGILRAQRLCDMDGAT